MIRILDTLRETVERYDLLADCHLVLVAVSGGSDSVFLLRALHDLKGEFGIELKAAHLNHMLRGEEAERDAQWVTELCGDLSVDCIVQSVDVRSYSRENRLSLEESARECRYEFLEKAREESGADRIALGHTMDDQAETLLLRLFRGSGTTGLSAMSPRRSSLIRPLIRMRRDEIRRFLDKRSYAYRDDPTNLDLKFQRNMVRHTIIPMLESRLNVPVVPVLARTASVLSEEDAFMEEVAQHDLRALSKDVEQALQLDSEAVEKLEEARKRRVLRAAIRKVRGDLRGIGSVHIEAIIDLIRSRSPGRRIDIPSITVYRDYDCLLLSSTPEGPTISYDKLLEVPGVTVIREADISFHSSIGKPGETQLDYSRKNKVFFDLDGLTLPISVRNRRPGDRFIPFAGREPKKLKEMFIDDKVSRRLRDSTPIVVDSEGILWIPGGRRSDRAPITETTERILCIEARKSFDRE